MISELWNVERLIFRSVGVNVRQLQEKKEKEGGFEKRGGKNQRAFLCSRMFFSDSESSVVLWKFRSYVGLFSDHFGMKEALWNSLQDFQAENERVKQTAAKIYEVNPDEFMGRVRKNNLPLTNFSGDFQDNNYFSNEMNFFSTAAKCNLKNESYHLETSPMPIMAPTHDSKKENTALK